MVCFGSSEKTIYHKVKELIYTSKVILLSLITLKIMIPFYVIARLKKWLNRYAAPDDRQYLPIKMHCTAAVKIKKIHHKASNRYSSSDKLLRSFSRNQTKIFEKIAEANTS